MLCYQTANQIKLSQSRKDDKPELITRQIPLSGTMVLSAQAIIYDSPINNLEESATIFGNWDLCAILPSRVELFRIRADAQLAKSSDFRRSFAVGRFEIQRTLLGGEQCAIVSYQGCFILTAAQTGRSSKIAPEFTMQSCVYSRYQ